jgi:hypothetical protein
MLCLRLVSSAGIEALAALPLVRHWQDVAINTVRCIRFFLTRHPASGRYGEAK